MAVEKWLHLLKPDGEGLFSHSSKALTRIPNPISSVYHLQHMCSTELPSHGIFFFFFVFISQLALGQHLIQHLDVLQCLQSKANSWFVCTVSPCSIIERHPADTKWFAAFCIFPLLSCFLWALKSLGCSGEITSDIKKYVM